MKLWQRIYENCHLLGMPLKFCYRRRILIGPKTLLRGWTAVYGKGSSASTTLDTSRINRIMRRFIEDGFELAATATEELRIL